MAEFNLKSGNTTPFKMMGSSPLKQAIGGDAGEQLTSWNKYKAATVNPHSKAIKVVSNTPTQLAKGGKEILKTTTKNLISGGKQILKTTAGKIASKFLGPIGWGLTAAEVIKTAPKVTKATLKGLKERAKSGNVNIGRKL
jgi:hypothetical protein